MTFVSAARELRQQERVTFQAMLEDEDSDEEVCMWPLGSFKEGSEKDQM